jgi:predicted GNAT family acetyltransferase
MHIFDKELKQHDVLIDDTIKLDSHVIANVKRHDETVTLDSYRIPDELQGKGIGTALLQFIEQYFRREGATRMVFVIEETLCPIYGRFFTKYGYVQTGNQWSKTLTLIH